MIPWTQLAGRLGYFSCMLDLCRRNAGKLGRLSYLSTGGKVLQYGALMSFSDKIDQAARAQLREDALRLVARMATCVAIVRGCANYQQGRAAS